MKRSAHTRVVERRVIACRAAVALGSVVLGLSVTSCSPRAHTPTARDIKIIEADIGSVSLAASIAEIDRNYTEPRADYRVEHSFRAALNSISPVNDYEALWRAVRACAWLSENHPLPSKRREYAKEGIAYGLEAQKRLSHRVEPYYYTGLCYIALSEMEDTPTPTQLKSIKYHLSVAREIDSGFDHCGPLRALGNVYLKTSDPDYTGPRIGNTLVAVEMLERACDGCPDFGANQLALANALRRVGEYSRARVALDRVLRSSAPADFTVEHRSWLHDAQGVRESISLLDDRSVEATAYDVNPSGSSAAGSRTGVSVDSAVGSEPANRSVPADPEGPSGIPGIRADGSVEPTAFRNETAKKDG